MRTPEPIGLILMFCISAVCSGESPTEVDKAEILRLGNVVQAVGAGPRSADADRYVEAMGPPASDADKWFISVITRQGCSACDQLKRDWAKDPWLRALADPGSPHESWSHYNVYAREDGSQAFRFEGLKVTGFPTVVLQPPRSGKYGDPKTVVFQGVYDGDPKALATSLAAALRQYVARLKPVAVNPLRIAEGSNGNDPPWDPVPHVAPVDQADDSAGRPSPGPLQLIPPPPAQQLPFPTAMSLLLAGAAVPAGIALLRWMMLSVRAPRQAAGKPVVLDSKTLDRIVSVLDSIGGNGTRPPPKQPGSM